MMEALTDAVGTVHHRPISGQRPRIVSLVPSITELICDLGLAADLVGRTGFCIHPWETVRHLPKVGGTKDVLLDRVRDLRPTHVIVNIDENTLATADALRSIVEHVIVTHPLDPHDNPPLYRLLGQIFAREQAAENLCADFDAALNAATAAAADRPSRNVLYLIWRDPWMTVSSNTYIARTLKLFGWLTVPPIAAARSGKDRYPTVDPRTVTDVDRVLLSSEPFHFKDNHIHEMKALLPDTEVSLIDGEMTSWYGSRAINGLRYLSRYTADRAV